MSVIMVLEAAANATTTTVATTPARLAPAPVANSTALSGVVPVIQNFATGFATNMNAVTLSLDSAALDIGKAAVVFLVIAGVILWFTRVNRRLGKELVTGGVFIGLFIEFVVPLLMNIHY